MESVHPFLGSLSTLFSELTTGDAKNTAPVTDNHSLVDAKSTKSVTEKRLRNEQHQRTHSNPKGSADPLVHTEEQLVDCLTKKAASDLKLLFVKVLEGMFGDGAGRYSY